MTESLKGVERVTTKQAAQELNMDLDTLQYLLPNGRIPIGYAVKKEGKKFLLYLQRTSGTVEKTVIRSGCLKEKCKKIEKLKH